MCFEDILFMFLSILYNFFQFILAGEIEVRSSTILLFEKNAFGNYLAVRRRIDRMSLKCS